MKIKLMGAAVAAVISMAALSACGGNGSSSSSSGYCDDLKTASTQLSGLNNATDLDQQKFDEIRTAVHTIAGEAPADVKSSWTLVDNQFEFLQNTLKDAGLS